MKQRTKRDVMGSAFLCHRSGIDSPASFANSAAYIKGWSNALKRDKKLVVWAAGKAKFGIAGFYSIQLVSS